MQKPNEKTHGPLQPGLVISYFGSSVAVETPDGQVFQCHLRRNQELPVVGDTVQWQLDENSQTGIIASIDPRRSELARGDGHGKAKPIAANIDVLVIVMAPAPIFSEYLVDRYLVAAELLKIEPILVLNKVDLLSNADREKAIARLQPFIQIPYPVLLTSLITQEGMPELDAYLQGKTAVLVGPSGVGKSSIISSFTQGESIKIGEVSPKGAGKHTTTATKLYHLHHGGRLVDSPGVREFTLWNIEKPQVLQGFKEFQSYLGGCKFRDCQHMAEPGCLVREALESGKISPHRYESYQMLMKAAGEIDKYAK